MKVASDSTKDMLLLLLPVAVVLAGGAEAPLDFASEINADFFKADTARDGSRAMSSIAAVSGD